MAKTIKATSKRKRPAGTSWTNIASQGANIAAKHLADAVVNHLKPTKVDIKNPLNIVDSQTTAETLYAKKRKVSKTKVKEKRFAKKVNKALSLRIPINSWVEYSNNDAPGTGVDTITNIGVVGFNDQNQMYSNSKSMYILQGGYSWNPLNLETKKYPWGVFLCAENSFGPTEGAQQNTIDFQTTYASATLKLWNVTGAGSDPAEGCPLWVNVYTFVAAQDILSADWKDIPTAISNLVQEYSGWTLAGYTSENSQRISGTTPLDFPGLGKYWTQESKTRIYMGIGAQAEVKIPKVRTPTWKGTTHFQKFGTNSWVQNYAYKGRTQCIYITADGFTRTLGLNSQALRAEVDAQYHYKFMENSTGQMPMSEAKMTRIGM